MLGQLLADEKVAGAVLTAVGTSTQDVRSLRDMGIPIWSVVLVSALAGGVLAVLYTPTPLLRALRGDSDVDSRGPIK